MYRTKFSIQIHRQKKKNLKSHFDLRILSKHKTFLISWALPKSKFPDDIAKKILAIRTTDHDVLYMYFEGILDNGDIVEIYDRGQCIVYLDTNDMKIYKFEGKKIKGVYNFIKFQTSSKDSWLILKSKKKI